MKILPFLLCFFCATAYAQVQTTNIPLSSLDPIAPGYVGYNAASGTGTPIAIPCLQGITPGSARVFDPRCYGSTGSGNTLVSQEDTAFNAAVAYMNANSTSATVVIPPGVWPICNAQQGWVIPQTNSLTLQGASLLGSRLSVSCQINRTALPAGTQTGQTISQGALWMPVYTSAATTQLHWSNFSAYANVLATWAADIEGLVYLSEFENINFSGATGDGSSNAGELRIGNSSFASQSNMFDSVMRHITFNSQNTIGSGAVIAVSNSGGTPTFTVSSGGSNYSANTVVTVNGPPTAAGRPCFNGSGILNQIAPTIVSGAITAVSNSGYFCSTGTLYAYAYDPGTGQNIQNALWLDHATDNMFYDLEPQIGAQTTVYVGTLDGNNVFTGTHPCCAMPIGIVDLSANTWISTELDSLGTYGAYISGATVGDSWINTRSFYNASYPGSDTYYISIAAGSSPLFIGGRCLNNQTNGGYALFSSTNGYNTFSSGTTITNEQECGAGAIINGSNSALASVPSRSVNTGTAADTLAAGKAVTYESANTVAGAFTLTFAAPVYDGERRRVCFKNLTGVVSYSVIAPATATVGLPVGFAAGQCAEYIYNSTSGAPTNAPATTWLPY